MILYQLLKEIKNYLKRLELLSKSKDESNNLRKRNKKRDVFEDGTSTNL